MLFSIIMPVYNNERYFPMAVQSILEQDYTDFELIIVDDGSTDSTPRIADELAAKDSRITVLHQKNQWIYASFNNGIRNASGEYIYIVNSDDRLLPGALYLMAQKLKIYHPDIIWTKILMHVCDSEQRILEYNKGGLDEKADPEKYYGNPEEVHKAWPYFFSSGLAYNQANLYRSEIMKSQPFRNDVYGADMLYNISIADKINTALVLQEPVYVYYIYPDDSMNASVGKYYGYEHEMSNEIYSGYRNLFESWKLPKESYTGVINHKRMICLTIEMKSLCSPHCPLSLEEKLQCALNCIDGVIEQCVSETVEREELESRILSGICQILLSEPIQETSEMYFVYELLDSLLRYEKDEEDYQKIERAVYHPLNPKHIGKTFYEKLRKEEKGRHVQSNF